MLRVASLAFSLFIYRSVVQTLFLVYLVVVVVVVVMTSPSASASVVKLVNSACYDYQQVSAYLQPFSC